MRKVQLFLKRIFDFTVSLILSITLFPFFLIIAVLIKLSSAGPVFFKQQRPGLNAEIFEVYKFRTMKQGSEQMFEGKEVLSDDDRVTAIGKYLRRFKVDELPQIFNVLKGEMSLVGPRPQRVDYLENYTTEEMKRFKMLPGLTGLAQVSGNIYLSVQERTQKDVEYVTNFNLLLDLQIMIRTIGVVLFGEDKFAKES
ncbi:sugar transferase [Planococcus sp. CP5-4]|uniref:sugar transferase n=1 Tax=unclassified Planococcus (in: firmicutes) TaxID=2662419 RepID=UPI001C221EBA|nr:MULTISPECIES: sugar transferase [unclassified Planococcus (in: firmicutes)]MBU9675098.1 sugar transferase [Planococcus sp. CP5-4_YE]MBV0908057.1 sugar transferase [Planococcus sp. CP5-4_UN]MBW6062118.1 sugar transferase [Planococcus sp. CP5-4]